METNAGLSNKNHMPALIEAMLFISPVPLKLADMYAVLKIPKKEIKDILDDMMLKNNFCGIEIIHENQAYCFKVKDQYLDHVRKFNQNKEFSRAEIQTLSFIAYKNPVNQSEIIKTRGNRAYEHIKSFLKEGFIDIEPNGHTSEISVTKKFLNYFGINTKEELQAYFESQMLNNAKEEIDENSSTEETTLDKYSQNELEESPEEIK
ncbi:MAG: SMC-Scp complex subunit ScpB [Candidatus Aenigmarchaeota archaeon]|nr:SMC-Scp complex subunit ScpB [Candidatus Aenigmarchaeota archaeon]